MFTKHEHFVDFEVPESSIVWRYMTTTKFLDLVRSQTLTFIRADIFEDKWEGKLSNANWDHHSQTYGDAAEALFSAKVSFEGRLSSLTHVSSWCLLDHESTAMWHEYGDDSKGIAIRTTWGQLSENLLIPGSMYGFKVQYRDYEADWLPEGNIFYPIIHKRHFFSHENEARIFFDSSIIETVENLDGSRMAISRPNRESIQVPMDLKGLDFDVFLGAKMPDWEKILVKSSVNSSSITCRFVDSALADIPRMRL